MNDVYGSYEPPLKSHGTAPKAEKSCQGECVKRIPKSWKEQNTSFKRVFFSNKLTKIVTWPKIECILPPREELHTSKVS